MHLEIFKSKKNHAKNLQKCQKLLEISFLDFCRQLGQICRQFSALPAINLMSRYYLSNFWHMALKISITKSKQYVKRNYIMGKMTRTE